MSSFTASNPHIAAALAGRRATHRWLAVPLTLVFMVLGSLPGGLAMVALSAAGLLPAANAPDALLQGVRLMLGLVLTTAGVIGVVCLWVRFVEVRPVATIGFAAQGWLGRYARGVLEGFGTFAVVVGILAALGMLRFEDGPPGLQGWPAIAGVALALVGFLVQGASEEVLIRGWLLPVLGARFNVWVGVLVSSLLFGLLHALNPNVTVAGVLNVALFGVFAAVYTLRQRGLWAISAWHSLWNWAQGNVFGLPVSGQGVSVTLLNLDEAGPDLITGGAFGPEAGLVTTLVLALMCAWVIWRARAAA